MTVIVPDHMEHNPELGMYVHKADHCVLPPCVLHSPSDHHMVDWPLVWRPFHGYFERQCPHGVGHPDPDSLGYVMLGDPDHHGGVHGCDGCCAGEGEADV